MSQKMRKIYKRQGIVHICYAGKLFAPGNLDEDSTEVNLDMPIAKVVEYEPVDVDGKPVDCVQVYQRRPKKKGVYEYWYATEIPPKRKAKVAKTEVTEVAETEAVAQAA